MQRLTYEMLTQNEIDSDERNSLASRTTVTQTPTGWLVHYFSQSAFVGNSGVGLAANSICVFIDDPLHQTDPQYFAMRDEKEVERS